MPFGFNIVVVLKSVLSEQCLDFLVWARRYLVNHRPREGNSLFVP